MGHNSKIVSYLHVLRELGMVSYLHVPEGTGVAELHLGSLLGAVDLQHLGLGERPLAFGFLGTYYS